jgi:hypothetical protein
MVKSFLGLLLTLFTPVLKCHDVNIYCSFLTCQEYDKPVLEILVLTLHAIRKKDRMNHIRAC